MNWQTLVITYRAQSRRHQTRSAPSSKPAGHTRILAPRELGADRAIGIIGAGMSGRGRLLPQHAMTLRSGGLVSDRSIVDGHFPFTDQYGPLQDHVFQPQRVQSQRYR